ncbi:hypothetical protein P9112_005225 [Eukaryota sp. TZLM1-RC]
MHGNDSILERYSGPNDPRVKGWYRNRYLILFCCFILEVLIGTIYGLSVFSNPIIEIHPDWRGTVSFAYSIGVALLGFLCPFAGQLIDKKGPRLVGMLSAAFFMIGHVLAGYFVIIDLKHAFWISYGVVAGVGLSLGYVTPVSPIVHWFPDLKGVASGIALSGFGLGTLVQGLVNGRLITAFGPDIAIMALGVYGGLIIFITSCFICMPPPGYFPSSASSKVQDSVSSERSLSLGNALKTFLFWRVWLTFLGAAFTGVSIMSLLSPIVEDVFDFSTKQAGFYLAIFSIVNTAALILYPAITDVLSSIKLSRKWVYVWLLLTQLIVCLFMPSIMTRQLLVMFMVATSVLTTGLTGSTGSLPSMLSEMFGSKYLSSLFGMTMIAWAAGGLVGSQILAAVQAHGQDTGVEDHLVYIPFFKYIPVLLAICLVAGLSLRPYKFPKDSVLPTSADNNIQEAKTE